MVRSRHLIDVETLRGLLGQPEIRIVDCRFELADPRAGRAAYLSGHIPGAVYSDLDKDLAGPVGPETGRHPLPDPVLLAHTFGALGIDNDTSVVVYDDSTGAIAARAWWLLRWLGHERARVLDGGFRAWVDVRYPTEKGGIDVQEREFAARPRNELILQTDEILRAGESASGLRLVDARSEARFQGVEEPIDDVAGHIPGTRNLPCADNVDEKGRWRSVGLIRERLEEVLGEPDGKPWSVMCGSGVTACHLVIAGLLAGYAEPRVYVGSWSEWITDSNRKVATGPERGSGNEADFAEYP